MQVQLKHPISPKYCHQSRIFQRQLDTLQEFMIPDIVQQTKHNFLSFIDKMTIHQVLERQVVKQNTKRIATHFRKICSEPFLFDYGSEL